jgi:hypothetical protein
MIPVLTLLFQAAPAAPPPESFTRRPVQGSRLALPDEIAPAIVPYLQCLLDSRGVRSTRDGHDVPPVVARGADCSAQRKLGAQRADEMLLQSGGKSADQRRALIESTLRSLEDFVAQTTHSPPAEKDSNASN